MDWPFVVQTMAALIAILNPIGAVPLYLTLTSPRDPRTTRHVTRNATLTVLVVLASSALVGQGILRFFGVTLPAFRVAGGLLVLLMAISMLEGRISPAKHNPEEAGDDMERASVAIVPLGMPILAGPGSISTAILLAQQAHTWVRVLYLGICILLATGIVFITFNLARYLGQRLGKTEIGIVNRIMGLILAAIAVQFIVDGLRELFPILRQTAQAAIMA